MQTKSISCLGIGDGWALRQERTHEPNSPVDCSRELSYRLLSERPSAPDTTYRTANRRTPLRAMR